MKLGFESLVNDAFWIDLLLDYDEVFGIEGMKRQFDGEKQEKKSITFSLPLDTLKQLEMVAEELNICHKAFFELAWGVLLQRYNNVVDVVFGEKEITEQNGENLVFPVRVRTKEDSINKTMLKALSNKNEIIKKHRIPFIENIEYVESLFETLISFVNENIQVSDLYEEFKGYPYPLMIVIHKKEETYEISLLYDIASYQEDDMQYVMRVFLNIMVDIIFHMENKVSKIQTLSTNMYDDMLSKYNHPIEELMSGSIMEIIQNHVDHTPDKLAVCYNNEKMTFRELDVASDAIVIRLLELGAKKNDLIALYTERSIQMIVSMLAILKIRAAFMPIYLETPDERIEYMITEGRVKLVIVYGTEKKMPRFGDDVQILDLSQNENLQSISNEKEINFKVEGDDVAFILYTSGTTGNPKGVITTHKALLSGVLTDIDNYKLNDSDITLEYSDYTYVQAMCDIFDSLVVGGTLCMVPDRFAHNFGELQTYCNENHVTKCSFTTSVLNALDPENYKYMGIVDSTGEPADADVLKKWVKNRSIFNTYGTTEVFNTSTYLYTGEETVNIPIGKPSKYSSYYILDCHGNLCGVGMIGELCVGGLTLSKGYLGNSALTEEKFIETNYSAGKVYRTGDMACWMMDGNVKCLKRIDDQVKINGRRIELGEIRCALRKIEGINNCAVFVNKDNSQRKKIYAFYMCDKEISNDDIRKQLAFSIPQYMIPAYLVRVLRIPVNKNGKVDKRALLNLENEPIDEFKKPTTDDESLVEKVFCEVFHLDRVGIDINLYYLGGDSMSAIQISSRLLDQGYIVTAADILKDMTIQKIAEKVCAQRINNESKEDPQTVIKEEDLYNQIKEEDLVIINGLF